MNIFRTPAFRAFALSLALPLFALWMAACDVDSVDSTTAVPSDNAGTIYNYSGLYMSVSNAAGSTNGYVPLVFPADQQSGEPVTWLRLLQYGSALEAYDNVNLVWEGSISVQNGAVASFSLRGKTTAGNDVDIVGTLATSSSSSSTSTSGATQVASTEATMNATWIEPSFSGSIFARATVSPAVTSSPPAELEIDPSSASLSTNKPTQVFTVSGGTEPYAWSASSGSLSSSSGSTVTFTSAQASSTITVTDANNQTATATATYTASGTGTETDNLSISPSGTVAFNTNNFIRVFTASGGSGSYTWNVTSTSFGTLSSSSGSQVTYTSKFVAGTNTVTVTDTDGDTASATAVYSL